jgi:hypothetical protein
MDQIEVENLQSMQVIYVGLLCQFRPHTVLSVLKSRAYPLDETL